MSTIFVVLAPSFSVGTERVNCCRTFACATGGDMMACANAGADVARTPAMAARIATTGRRRMRFDIGGTPSWMRIVPPVTLLLMAACIPVYARQLMSELANVGRVIDTGATHRDEVLNGEL